MGGLLLLYLAKLLRHPAAVLDEYMNPAQGTLMTFLPLSEPMLVILLGHPDSAAWLAFTLLALALQLAIAERVVSMLSLGHIQSRSITPALCLQRYVRPIIGIEAAPPASAALAAGAI